MKPSSRKSLLLLSTISQPATCHFLPYSTLLQKLLFKGLKEIVEHLVLLVNNGNGYIGYRFIGASGKYPIVKLPVVMFFAGMTGPFVFLFSSFP